MQEFVEKHAQRRVANLPSPENAAGCEAIQKSRILKCAMFRARFLGKGC